MTSPAPDKRRNANRRNARRSTGPRTAAGKARAAENSLKHGLAVPIAQTPGGEACIEEMARVIAGEGADPTRLDLARRVAEAQLDLVRIREARRRLLDDPKARQKKLGARALSKGVRSLMRWGDKMAAKAANQLEYDFAIDEAFHRMELLMSGGEADDKLPSLVDGLGQLAPQLLRLERYERRATSRRKTATRAYDAYCRSCERPGGEGAE